MIRFKIGIFKYSFIKNFLTGLLLILFLTLGLIFYAETGLYGSVILIVSITLYFLSSIISSRLLIRRIGYIIFYDKKIIIEKSRKESITYYHDSIDDIEFKIAKKNLSIKLGRVGGFLRYNNNYLTGNDKTLFDSLSIGGQTYIIFIYSKRDLSRLIEVVDNLRGKISNLKVNKIDYPWIELTTHRSAGNS